MSVLLSIRRYPLPCALAAAGRLLRGQLRLVRTHVGKTLRTDEGQQFEVFRHMTLETDDTGQTGGAPAVLVVRFEFARLSERANRLTSLLPIPLIAGFPGFSHKLWMSDSRSGSWLGVYQWESVDAAQAYQRSFVFGVMGRRAAPNTLSVELLPAMKLADFLGERFTD